jgi:hypothetical protein
VPIPVPIPGNAPLNIEEFLAGIENHPAISDSKLSEEEKLNLDAELTISEFDTAVRQIKTNSSPLPILELLRLN